MDAFSEDAVSLLLADLDRESDRLVPLLAGAKEPGLSKLQAVFRQAGSRHNRWHLVELPS